MSALEIRELEDLLERARNERDSALEERDKAQAELREDAMFRAPRLLTRAEKAEAALAALEADRLPYAARVAEAVKQALAAEADDYVDNADLDDQWARDEVAALGDHLRSVDLSTVIKETT